MRVNGTKGECKDGTAYPPPALSICNVYLFSGCYWYADGSMYDGLWAHGKMHGKGVFIYPNGNRWVWEEDGYAYRRIISQLDMYVLFCMN